MPAITNTKISIIALIIPKNIPKILSIGPSKEFLIFLEIEKGLHEFMRLHDTDATAEYYIPNIVTDMILSGQMAVRVIPTDDNWFGVTCLLYTSDAADE